MRDPDAAARHELADALRAARALLARSGNDYSWSSFGQEDDALKEMDGLIAAVEEGELPRRLHLDVLFAPTGPIQEVSLSSGWGDNFLEVAARFDAAADRLYGKGGAQTGR